MREWLSGRASPCQGEGRGFESRLALLIKDLSLCGLGSFLRCKEFGGWGIIGVEMYGDRACVLLCGFCRALTNEHCLSVGYDDASKI